MRMQMLLVFVILLLTFGQLISGQNNTIFQNITVSPNQLLSFQIPGARLIGLLTLFKMLFKFGGPEIMGRCLGAARKLKFIMPFLLYKLGVIVTTLGFLTIFVLKSLAIGIVLLVLNAAGWLGKLALLKTGHGSDHHPAWSGKLSSPVHIHVHKDHTAHFNHHGPYEGYSHGSDYDPAGTSWSERISKGFNVNSLINRDLEARGVHSAYPKRVSPTHDNPIR